MHDASCVCHSKLPVRGRKVIRDHSCTRTRDQTTIGPPDCTNPRFKLRTHLLIEGSLLPRSYSKTNAITQLPSTPLHSPTTSCTCNGYIG